VHRHAVTVPRGRTPSSSLGAIEELYV
jgi:hypothetical protein